MRPRTFILLILVLLVGAVAVVLLIANGGLLPGASPTGTTTPDETVAEGTEPGIPAPSATPSVFLRPVIIAKTDIPVGERIRSDIVEIEERPNTNIALQGGYTFDAEELEDLVGQIAKVNISKGQAILRPMLALNPTDLSAFGSDLALYIDQGKVAVAFPIGNFTGAAYAMRAGDLVDVMMTLSLVDLDEEFDSELPNKSAIVDQAALAEGTSFLLDDSLQGRLEWIPELQLTAEIKPRTTTGPNGEEPGVQIPRRATQLTIQQAEVLWMGTWRPQNQLESEEPATAAEDDVAAVPTPIPGRFEDRPDVVILSLASQDALLLKWAQEVGIDIDLALRAQGDRTVFTTTSVTLPQIVEQGGLTIPETGLIGLAPPVNEVEPPSLPPRPPGN